MVDGEKSYAKFDVKKGGGSAGGVEGGARWEGMIHTLGTF